MKLALLPLAVLIHLSVFAYTDEKPKVPAQVFEQATAKTKKPFMDPKTIEELNAAAHGEYVLGPGDRLLLEIWDQQGLSGEHVIGPDGMMTLPLVGPAQVSGLTRGAAAHEIKEKLARYYKDLSVNLKIIEYKNNRVFVLGRVEQPGLVALEGQATLLEVLARVGSITARGTSSSLASCAVIRGKDMVIWVDLNELLHNGNLRLNLNLANGDIVYIPFEYEPMIYVMGEVESPGAYRLTPGMSFLDGLMRAGGPTEDARKNHLSLIRQKDGQAHIMRIKTRDFRKGDLSGNIQLEENDIIFVSRKWIGNLNYVLRQLDPFISLLVVREAISDD